MNGECQTTSSTYNLYTCSCQAGYGGTNCEVETDECSSNPCQRGAECSDLVDAFYCECPAGSQGRLILTLIMILSYVRRMYIALMKNMLDNMLEYSGYDLPCCKLKDHFFDGNEAIVRNRSVLRDKDEKLTQLSMKCQTNGTL